MASNEVENTDRPLGGEGVSVNAPPNTDRPLGGEGVSVNAPPNALLPRQRLEAVAEEDGSVFYCLHALVLVPFPIATAPWETAV